MKLLLLLGFCLFSYCVQAQHTTVTGRVTDRSTGEGLPGTTVLQLNTTNGVSSDADGNFSLSVPDAPDSVTLILSTIGYVRQQRRVAVDSYSEFALLPDTRGHSDLIISPNWQIGLASGTRYAPVGARIHFLGSSLRPILLNAQVEYQVNFDRNYAALASVALPPLHTDQRLSFTENLTYQQLQAEPANVRFRSYSATVGVSIYRIGEVRVPDLLVGAGYAQYKLLQPEAGMAATTGYGYSFGLRHTLPHPLWADVQVLATRWPGYWQLQGRASRAIFGKFSAGVNFNQLQRYQEISLTLSRFFY